MFKSYQPNQTPLTTTMAAPRVPLISLPHLSDSSKSTKTAQQDSPTNSSISSKSGIGKGGGKGSTVDAAFVNGEMIIGGVNGETTKSSIDDFKKNKKKHKDNLHFVLKTYLMGYMPFCMDDEDGEEAVSICMAKARMDCPTGMLLFVRHTCQFSIEIFFVAGFFS